MTLAAAEHSPWTGAIDYVLPPELIAQQPAARRDAARLMVVRRSSATLEHRVVAELPDLIGANDLVVANDSHVIPARLRARKQSGGAVEILLVRAANGQAEALAKSSKRLRAAQRLALEDGSEVEVTAVREDGRCALDFGDRDALEVAQRLGRVPLPPYIRRGEEGPGDRERYQTVYARASPAPSRRPPPVCISPPR